MSSAAAVPISPSLRVDSGAAATGGADAAAGGGIGALGAAGRVPVALAAAGRVPVALADGGVAGTGRNTGVALAGGVGASDGAAALNTTPQCTQNFALA
jgi:hypothetical protein